MIPVNNFQWETWDYFYRSTEDWQRASSHGATTITWSSISAKPVKLTKIIDLNHHLGRTRSVWWCLYLQRPCPPSVFSDFAVFGTFLGINLWAMVSSPQPITARRVWGAGLYKNVATSCVACALWAGEEGPTLAVAFTNSNQRILLIMPLKVPCRVFL